MSIIRVVFKNLPPSELARAATIERLEPSLERFPELKAGRLTVTLSMDNSPQQPGPDAFGVKVRIEGGLYDGIVLEKTSGSLYAALADAEEHLLERLNRFGDRKRVRRRRQARRLAVANN